MTHLRLGDEITFRGRVYRVRGFSPMSVNDDRVLLEDVETNSLIEVVTDEMREVAPADECSRRNLRGSPRS